MTELHRAAELAERNERAWRGYRLRRIKCFLYWYDRFDNEWIADSCARDGYPDLRNTGQIRQWQRMEKQQHA